MHELNLRPIAEGLVKCGGDNVVETNESIGLITFQENNNDETFYIERIKKKFLVGDDVSITCVVVADSSFDITIEWYYARTEKRECLKKAYAKARKKINEENTRTIRVDSTYPVS